MREEQRMPTWAVLLIILCAAAAAGAIQTVCGFGAGVLLMLVLSQFFDMLTAPAVNLLVCVFLCLALAWKLRREIQFKLILIPLIPYLISSALVNLVVKRIDLQVLGILFGVFQMLLCLYYLLIAKRLKTKPTPSAGVICGFLSGITASFFGVGGPFLAVYLIGASRSKESYTANMQFIFLITNVIIFVNKAMKGLFSLQLVPITVAGILGVLLGQWFGTKLTDRLDIDKMKMVVYVFIGISGLITIMQYIR